MACHIPRPVQGNTTNNARTRSIFGRRSAPSQRSTAAAPPAAAASGGSSHHYVPASVIQDTIHEATSSMISVAQNEAKTVDLHADNLLSGLEALWRQTQLCDVTIHVGDERFRAHKSVLSSCSEFFLTLFLAVKPDESHTCETEVYFNGELTESSFKSILECMYSGRLDISEANVRELLQASAYLKFYNIMEACDEFLMQRLSTSNCLRMLSLACTYGMHHLQSQALKLAALSFLDVTDGFDYMQMELDQLVLLLARDDIHADSELDIFRRALAWIEHDKAARSQYSLDILETIRLPLLSPSDIVDNVENIDSLRSNPDCQMLIKEALHYHCLPARQSLLQTARTVPRSSCKREVILAIGGAPRLKSQPVSRMVQYLDADSQSWQYLTSLREPRHHHAAAVLGGFLYIAGGEETNDQRSPLNTAYRFDPRNNTWLQIANMINRRESFQLGVLAGMLYAVGGRVDQDASLADVERYNPAVDVWEQVAPLSTPRRSVAACAHGGRLYAMGGSGHKRISSKVERYNPLCNQWESRRPLASPRFFGHLVSCGRNMYLLGGATLSSSGAVICINKVECYNPTTDSWSTLRSMSEPRAEAGCTVSGTNSIYLLGGYSWDQNVRLNSAEVYDIESDSWSSVSPISCALTGISAVALTCYIFPLCKPDTPVLHDGDEDDHPGGALLEDQESAASLDPSEGPPRKASSLY